MRTLRHLLVPFALIGILAAVLPAVPESRAEDAARLRLDGVYHKTGYSQYLRFFEDGRMVSIEEEENSGRVATYSSEEVLAMGSIGRYSVRGTTLEFSYTLPSSRGSKKVKGKAVIGPDSLDTDLPSWDTKRSVFRFFPSAQPGEELPLGEARLRLDGAYEYPDPYRPDETHYLKFFEDGRVNLVRAKRGLGQHVAEYGSHWSVATRSAKYSVRDGVVEFDGGTVALQPVKENGRYSARLGAERLEVSFLGVGRTTPEVRRYYTFVAPRPLAELIKVRVGRLVAAAGNAEAQFQEATEFPAGSREIAYEIAIDPEVGWRVESGITLLCATAAATGRTNNSYSIVRGEPVVTRSFTVVGCTDGGPLLKGSYKVWVTAGGRPVTEVELAVR